MVCELVVSVFIMFLMQNLSNVFWLCKVLSGICLVLFVSINYWIVRGLYCSVFIVFFVVMGFRDVSDFWLWVVVNFCNKSLDFVLFNGGMGIVCLSCLMFYLLVKRYVIDCGRVLYIWMIFFLCVDFRLLIIISVLMLFSVLDNFCSELLKFEFSF